MNPDFVDLLHAFAAADVRYLVVGAYAVSLHSRPRSTGEPVGRAKPRQRRAVLQ